MYSWILPVLLVVIIWFLWRIEVVAVGFLKAASVDEDTGLLHAINDHLSNIELQFQELLDRSAPELPDKPRPPV